MLLFAIILLGIFTLSGIVVFWMELSITNDRLIWLEERLNKLEKDTVKITFSEPYSPQDEKSIAKSVKLKKRKPKTVGEWEDEIDLGGHE